jgi:DNA invertase Pin-like site-specific DNA recombinase
MKLYGYARVSTKGQNNDRQVAEIQKYADSTQQPLTACFTETMSGNTKSADRPELVRLVAQLRRGDRLVVTEISRLGRRTSEVLATIEQLSDKGVSVLALNYSMETLGPTGKRNPMAQLLFTFLAEFARLERETLSERVKSGLEHAKQQGRVGGRPKGAVLADPAKVLAKYPKVTKRLQQGHPIREIAKLEEVSEGTVERVRKAWLAVPASE